MSKEQMYKGITQQYLLDNYVYDTHTGAFHRKATNKPLTAKTDGYVKCVIGIKECLVHRLAWLLIHGELPEEIDHINGDRADNRLCNLKAATRSENQRNSSLRIDNKSGVVGVSKYQGGWVANISVDGKRKYLGWFKDKFAAIQVRSEAEITYNYHRNHGK